MFALILQSYVGIPLCQKLSGLDFVVECTNRLSFCTHASVSVFIIHTYDV